MVKGRMMFGGVALMLFASFGTAAAQQGKSTTTSIRVENTREVPVVVYLERGMFDTRLGTVPPLSQETLALPRTLEDREEIEVVMHPEGGIDLSTGEFRARRGETRDILVPTNDVGYIPPQPPERIPNPGPGTTVTVQNYKNVPVTVYVERGDFDTRIGTVPANQEETLPIPEWIAKERASTEIFVHPEGGADLKSWVFDLKPGDHLGVKVPSLGKKGS